MELNIYSISTIIGIAGAVIGGAFALGKLFEKVNQLEKRLDRLDSTPDKKKIDPLSILDEKYAKGDLTTEEYEERKKKLQDD